MTKKILYIPAILLFIAIFGLPYGYYTLLRLVVTGISIYAAFFLFERDSFNFWAFLGIALLFNPLIPVHLSREVWFPINIIVGVYFTITAYRASS
ncbi:DUF6804 family protein [Porticoccus sp. Uisw_050_02]|uniref:DUF6804 family protein n=1 Tax=Porticoccus sp. Uisw_050_02 TaxID=3230978 RepID=UPI0039ED2AB4|tara:strand:+ start:1155 stop:1439 length:285 start_codon:yes stop_codon:yes gene_type:complete